jgi:hypothetical protein
VGPNRPRRQDPVVAWEDLDELPTLLSISSPVEVSTRSAAAAYLTLAWTAAWPSSIGVCDFPAPAGPMRARFSRAGIHFSEVRYAYVGGGSEETLTSNSSMVFRTGNVAALRRQQPISVGDDLDSGPDQPHPDGVAG